MSAFEELASVDCSQYAEKKGKFTYLSWPFALSELSKRHPKAEICVHEWEGFPAIRGPKGWMVKVTITINDVSRTQWHPILDHNNRTILEPDVFAINTSIQRATVKAIALHGLGLYIYAGEDLPEGAQDQDDEPKKEPLLKSTITPTSGAWEAMSPEQQKDLNEFAAKIKNIIASNDIDGAIQKLKEEYLAADEMTALWTRFDSKQRSALKSRNPVPVPVAKNDAVSIGQIAFIRKKIEAKQLDEATFCAKHEVTDLDAITADQWTTLKNAL